MAIKSVKTVKENGKEKKSSLNLQSRAAVYGIAIFGSIAFSAIAYWGFVKPQFDKVGPGRELDVESLQAQVQAKEDELALMKQLEANYNAIDEREVDLISRMLPDKALIPELVAQLEAIARQSGVSIQAMNITEVEETQTQSARQRLQAQVSGGAQAQGKQGVQTISVRLDVAAFSYPSFETFIKSLQSHVRIIDVERFNYGVENQFHSVVIETYYLAS